MWNEFDSKELIGKTITNIKGEAGDESLVLELSNGEKYEFFHEQDCCENVYLEDVCGDLLDLIGSPILLAEEVTSEENPVDAKKETIEYQESFTWTFYKLGTINGRVTLRFYGESNGYYSENISFRKLD